MKKTLLILFTALIVAPGSTFAQSYPVDRSSLIVGGSAALTSQSLGNDERLTSLLINPDVQYFVIPNLSLGGTVGFFLTSFDGETDAAAFLGPTLGYYFGGPNRQLYPFLSGSFQFDVEDFNDSASILLEGGGAYMIARNVALSGALFYNGLLEDPGDQNAFGLRFGIKAFIF